MKYFAFIAVLLCGCDGLAVTRFLDTAGSMRISLSVSGLLGSGLTFSSAGDTLAVEANGTHTFAASFRKKQSYSVSVSRHPTGPNQHCAIANASGMAGDGDLILQVNCTFGSAAGRMVAGNIDRALSLSGNVDLTLGSVFVGSIGASAGTDGTGNAARLISPAPMVTDGFYIYLLESNGIGTVRRITIATREVVTIGDIGGNDGITTDGFYLYATGSTNCTVRKMSLTDFSVTLLAGADFTCAFADAPAGPGSAARFHSPLGITHDGTWLYVADYTNNRIRRVDPVSGATTTFAGTGATGSANGPAASATFDLPHGLIYYGGKLYTAESTPVAQFVRTIDLSGSPFTVSALAGTGTWGCNDGAGAVAEFKKLRNLVADGAYLYATDKECYAVRRIDLATGFTSTLSGWESRTTTTIGTGGAGGTAGFREPIGIAADGTNLFVTDSSDFVLRRIE